MTGETLTRLYKFDAAYGREVSLDNVDYESGMRLLRVTIRERRRFTIFELDAATASHWAGVMTDWSKQAEQGR